MIAYVFRMGSCPIDWQDIAIVALLVIVASMAAAAIWYVLNKRPSSSTSWYGYKHGAKTLSQELLSLKQDRERKVKEKSALKEIVIETERKLKVIQKTVEAKLGLSKQLDDDLVSTEHEKSPLGLNPKRSAPETVS